MFIGRVMRSEEAMGHPEAQTCERRGVARRGDRRRRAVRLRVDQARALDRGAGEGAARTAAGRWGA